MWWTKLCRELDAQARDHLEWGFGRDGQEAARRCADSILTLARTHLSENVTESVATGESVTEVTALDRVIEVIVPCSLNFSRWVGYANIAADLIVDLAKLDARIHEHYQKECLESMCGSIEYWTSASGDPKAVSQQDQNDATEKLFATDKGRFRLPADALSRNGRLVLQSIVTSPQKYGVDLNGLAKTDDEKRRLLMTIIHRDRDPQHHIRVGSVALGDDSDRRVQAWLDQKPDLGWVWGYANWRSADLHKLPVFQWAGHSRPFCRWVIEQALDMAKSHDFPSLAVNRLSPDKAPLIHYAISHEMTDLVERLIEVGADPLWMKDVYSPLGQGICGTYMPFGGHILDWYGSKGVAKQLYERCATPGIDEIVRAWPSEWGDDEFVVPHGTRGLSGPIYPMGRDDWQPNLATLLRLNLADVEGGCDGYKVWLGDDLKDRLKSAGDRPSVRG